MAPIPRFCASRSRRPAVDAPSAARLALALALAAVAGLGTGCQDPEEPPRPSVLLISIDTLRADHVHSYGYDRETTPNLDRLAAEGVLFEEHVSNTSWTLPSHLSLLTGLPETVHGVETDDRVLDPARTTLAEVLQGEGYRTAGFFSGPYLHPTYGFAQGFEVYESAMVVEPPPEQVNWHLISDTDRMRLIERHQYQTSTGPELATRANAWLDSLGGDAPFFLFLHFFDCHWDYMPPEEYWRLFDPDYDDETFDGRRFIASPLIKKDMPQRHLRHLIARYDGEIRFTDEMIGRVLEHLERLGLDDDTLIVITSDHGEEFFEHGTKGHRNNLYDESLRVPLILRFGDVLPAGRRVTAQSSIVDVTPTILDVLGIAPLREMRGQSLAPLWGETPDAALLDRTAYGRLVLDGNAQLGTPGIYQRFARTRTRKLISSRLADPGAADPIDSVHYFNLEKDPGELGPAMGTSRKGGFPIRSMGNAYRHLEDHDRKGREFASKLEQLDPDAVPQVDEELRRQLQQNGYLGGG